MKTIYTNGYILTMDDHQATAVVEEDGMIVAVGDVKALYEDNMNVVDLKGHTLMPAFIDGHGHLSGMAMGLLQVDLKECQCIKDIQEHIKDDMVKHPQKDFIICQGYDHHVLQEHRHITKQELDDISLYVPIVIQHQSGHSGVMNSAALHYMNINEHIQQPEGGKIDYDTGFLEEKGFIDYFQRVPLASLEELKKAYHEAQDIYASYGITTIQEGMIVDELIDVYKMLIKDDQFFLDVVGYCSFDAQTFIKTFHDYINHYKHHFKIGGYKMFLDGSPQNKTAWTISPYIDGTFGYPTLTDQQIQTYLKKAIHENIQVLAHCNGDQAIQHYIDQYSLVKKQDIRPVIVHAQMMREAQMSKAKELNMIPSFFVAHVYHFGEIHKRNMGEKRAQTISPLKSALDHQLMFTLHQDAPVIQPNMLETISIAVNRETKSGNCLGKEQAISALEALKSVTIHAAYQYHEEDIKGSLTVGKKADMIILSDNPLTVDSHCISNIQILQTIKDGKIIKGSPLS